METSNTIYPANSGTSLSSGRNTLGTIEISDGDRVNITGNGATGAGFQAGREVGPYGTIAFTGTGSELNLTGADAFVRIGGQAKGVLDVLAGGKVSVFGRDNVNRFDIGQSAGGDRPVTVNGTNSPISLSGFQASTCDSTFLIVGR